MKIANAIADGLEQLGFDPYIAVQEQTLRGLKENIFEQLTKSEYYIFVDFKREQLQKTDPPVCRGSLFSHQELALASFLDIPLVALQESGVKQDDGILRFLQANALPFSDRNLVPDVIASEVQKRNWDPHWRNELVLERELGQFSDAQRMIPNAQVELGRFFHVTVRNRHRHKTARNCYVYLERVINLDNSVEIPVKAVELKWAGYIMPNAHIPPGHTRRFDSFWRFHGSPTVVRFNVYADSSEYIPKMPTHDEARYELSYLVVADNFPSSRGSFLLNLRNSLNLTTFESHP